MSQNIDYGKKLYHLATFDGDKNTLLEVSLWDYKGETQVHTARKLKDSGMYVKLGRTSVVETRLLAAIYSMIPEDK
jgi:hypothetical protein